MGRAHRSKDATAAVLWLSEASRQAEGTTRERESELVLHRVLDWSRRTTLIGLGTVNDNGK